jgi:predicted RNA binding protein YcfA (HicA-like mRNA interferase family)
MNRRRLLKRLLEGGHKNVRFDDFVNLIEAFGFEHARSRGSHHIYKHPEVDELLNLQAVQGQAKPYQIKQFLKIVEAYNLTLEEYGE